MSIKRKERLFRQGRAALAALGVADQAYACPICCSLFEHNALLSGALTLEHAPPKSQGGKGIILTCKSCNNRSGEKIDSELARKSRFISQVQSIVGTLEYESFVKIELVGVSLNARLKRGLSAVSISVPQRHNDPRSLNEVQQNVGRLTDGYSLKVTSTEGYNKRLASIGDLKSAFLLVSAKFGYSFSASVRLFEVRSQILNPEDNIFPVKYVDISQNLEGKIAVDQSRSIILVGISRFPVLLPTHTGSNESFVDFLESPARQISMDVIDWPTNFEAIFDHRS